MALGQYRLIGKSGGLKMEEAGAKILIVEDEFIIALDLQLRFENWGWRVLGPAPDVASALQLLETERPSAALLDVNLGSELVTPVAERLKACEIPFVMASANDNLEWVGSDALRNAINVGKPVIEGKLLAAINQLLAE